MEQVTRLYPTPNATRALAGLFLDEPLRELARAGDPFVYTNFVSSLDGRIAVRDESGRWGVPSAISTSQDHRLYRELAAQADVVLVSVRHAKGMLNNDALQPFPWLTPADDSDLKQWRLARGLSESPALAVATTRLQFPGGELQRKLACPVHCLTGTGPTVDAKEAMQNDNVDVLVG